jgi:hypothetical protein
MQSALVGSIGPCVALRVCACMAHRVENDTCLHVAHAALSAESTNDACESSSANLGQTVMRLRLRGCHASVTPFMHKRIAA